MSISLERFEEQIQEMIDSRITNIGKAIRLIIPEYNQIICKNPPLQNTLEGWALLHLVMEQLWEEVKKDKNIHSTEQMRKAAILIGATTMRFLIDLCMEEKQKTEKD